MVYIKGRPLPLWASLFTIAGLAVLLGLGTWQLQRLQWKQGVLAELEAAYQIEDLPVITTRAGFQALPSDASFFPVKLQGVYDAPASVMLTPRTNEGKSGAHLITPLTLRDGSQILVNRGWVSPDYTHEQEEIATPAVVIRALMRKAERPNLFVPENNPADGQWHRLNAEEIAAHLDLDLATDKIAYVMSEMPSTPVTHESVLVWQPPNNHLGYAIFWFSMGAVLIIIYYLRFLKRRPS